MHVDLFSRLVDLLKDIASEKGRKGYPKDARLLFEVVDSGLRNDIDSEQLLSCLNNLLPADAGNLTEVIVLGMDRHTPLEIRSVLTVTSERPTTLSGLEYAR
ncbi:MAG: hypothetical protein HY299_12290 [Verrucomicrobia bacterium]|nr:hypothetical protein [Verrucomicrobiota bacterium]